MVFPPESSSLIAGLRFVVWRIAVKEALRPVILFNQFLKVFILNDNGLEPLRRNGDKREIFPHSMWLSTKAIQPGSIAITNQGIKIGRPPDIRKISLRLQCLLHSPLPICPWELLYSSAGWYKFNRYPDTTGVSAHLPGIWKGS